MRMIKKGGSTPSGRRLDRRKMAIAAAAALLITAATARANVVDFVVNQSQSSLTVTSTQLLNAFDDSFPNDSTVPQDGGGGIGATTNFYGHLYVDLNPGTVQLLAGSSLSAARNGNWYPAQTGDGTVTQASSGLKEPGNYGLSYAFVGDKERQDGIRLDVFNGLNPPMPLSGTNFNLGDTFMQMVSGTSFNFNGPVIDLVPPFANFTKASISDASNQLTAPFGFNGLPLQGYVPGGVDNPVGNALGPLFQASGIPAWGSSGTWDGTTLTLEIHTRDLITDTVYHGIPTLLAYDGTIVLTPFVPEPSTVTLLGFGIACLLSYAYRARKRKAAVT